MVTKISLTQGYVAVIDDEDVPLVMPFRWNARKIGGHVYAWSTGNAKLGLPVIGMHRLITNCQQGQLVDHIDRDGLNNTRANLRLATRAQNRLNARRSSNNTSGFKGVHRCGRTRRWRSVITVDGRKIRLGWFDSREDAARAYDAAAVKHYGDFARLNFPQ